MWTARPCWLLARRARADLGRNPGPACARSRSTSAAAPTRRRPKPWRDAGPRATLGAGRRSRGGRTTCAEAIARIEDYHPLDVECAAAALCLLRGIRERHPSLRYLIDGDGGDENLKSYPLEDSDLTLSSVLRNPLLYQEGWGIDAIKHSLVYSGGLSRGYMRTFVPAARYGFDAFSPFTLRSVIAAAAAMPFDAVLGGDPARLGTLKQDVVRAGVRAVTGIDMPMRPSAGSRTARRRPRGPRSPKAWCRRAFNELWEDALREAEEVDTIAVRATRCRAVSPPGARCTTRCEWTALAILDPPRGRKRVARSAARAYATRLGRGARRTRRARAHGGRLPHQSRVPLPLRDVRPVGQHARRDRAAAARSPLQIRGAIATLPPARQVKLYNAGSFFDPRAIPPADDAGHRARSPGSSG